ncbi:MAG: helix-turn-helix transcriptional regulator [Niabella sp.]
MEKDFLRNTITLWKEAVRIKDTDEMPLRLEAYKKLFNLFQIGDYYFYVFNFSTMECEYFSPGIAKVLGYREGLSVDQFLNKIHPADTGYYLHFENAAMAFLRNLPHEKLGKYKIQYDFRIKNVWGEYVRILHQAILIHYDEYNNFYRSLALHTNISHIKKSGTPCLSFIGLEEEPSYINVETPNNIITAQNNFTPREKTILKMIVEGKSSEKIADELFISLHTVNTHRKNILSKADVKTPLDLTRKALSEGWV